MTITEQIKLIRKIAVDMTSNQLVGVEVGHYYPSKIVVTIGYPADKGFFHLSRCFEDTFEEASEAALRKLGNDDVYYEIISCYGGYGIGSTHWSGIPDVLEEEPGSSFRQISKKEHWKYGEEDE